MVWVAWSYCLAASLDTASTIALWKALRSASRCWPMAASCGERLAWWNVSRNCFRLPASPCSACSARVAWDGSREPIARCTAVRSLLRRSCACANAMAGTSLFACMSRKATLLPDKSIMPMAPTPANSAESMPSVIINLTLIDHCGNCMSVLRKACGPKGTRRMCSPGLFGMRDANSCRSTGGARCACPECGGSGHHPPERRWDGVWS